MANRPNPTRRRLLQGGALLAAPLAASSASAVIAAGSAADRLRRLEDEGAIRAVHGNWLREINSGGASTLLPADVRRVMPDPAGKPERLQIEPEGTAAAGVFDCAVEFETPVLTESSLGHMAHLQGHGRVHHIERRTVTVRYVRRSSGWEIADVALAPT